MKLFYLPYNTITISILSSDFYLSPQQISLRKLNFDYILWRWLFWLRNPHLVGKLHSCRQISNSQTYARIHEEETLTFHPRRRRHQATSSTSPTQRRTGVWAGNWACTSTPGSCRSQRPRTAAWAVAVRPQVRARRAPLSHLPLLLPPLPLRPAEKVHVKSKLPACTIGSDDLGRIVWQKHDTETYSTKLNLHKRAF